MPKRLNKKQLHACLSQLEGWALLGDKLYRQFEFKGFNQAFAFITRAALWSERHNHHPEWFNVYNRLEIWLTTHDADGISNLDVDFAKFLSSMYDSV